ncbi:zinc finger, PHD-type [Artemisia annua]|uniref:Zinc finger, PHD-type n=1 Tax=Artemisia annua TaxID=35608 RepID=A0A2U1P0A1_ARTAN|nr:zinc finger, PHD-type [Artemisia annua]
MEKILEHEHPLHLIDLQPNYPHYEVDTLGLCYCCRGCEFIIHGNCAIASIEDRLIYHPSHPHPLAATLEPLLSKCYACENEHKGTFYICTTCFGLFIHSDCAFLPEKLMIQNATNNIFSHPHPLILSYSFPREDQKTKNFPRCRVCNSTDYGTNTWIFECEKCRYYAHIHCATSGNENRKLIKNYEDSDYPDLLHLPFPDESYSIQKHMFSKLVEHGTSEADDQGNIKHNFHPHLLILVRTVSNDITSTSTSTKTAVISCHNPMKKVQLLCSACVRPVTSVPFYKCVNDDCNFVLHDWCTQLPTRVDKYPGHPQHTLILHSNAPNEFLSVFRCDVCGLECNGFVYSCIKCRDYHIDVTCSFIPLNITHEAHSGHLLSTYFIKRDPRAKCLMCQVYVYSWDKCTFACDTCEAHLHVKCVITFVKFARTNSIQSERCFYHCHECAWSIHTACAPHILQSETSTSYYYPPYGPYEFVNIKFGGIHKFRDLHPDHPLSFVQGIPTDAPCTQQCGYKVEYRPILKCQKCKFVIHFYCCERKWRNGEVIV